ITSSQLTEPSGTWDDATIWIAPSENQAWQFGFIGPVLDHTRTAAGGRIRATLYTSKESFYHLHDDSTRFYLFNARSALDHPGEWYLDPTTNRLYVWLPGDADPTMHEISMRRRDLAFDCDSRSWITIRDLDIHAATISTDADLGTGAVYGHDIGNGGRALGSIATSQHVTIDGIDARYVSHFHGATAFAQRQWWDISGILLSGENHSLRNSSIMFSAGNGVMLWGRGHRVINNFISDTQYQLQRGGGVCLPTRSAWDMEVADNTIVRSGWTAIDSDECQLDFHHNFIDNFSTMGHDTGGTHFVGSGWAESDIRIRRNVFRGGLNHDVQGIYFDFCDQYLIEHNIVYHTNNGINLNGSFGGDVFNNSLVTFDGGIGGRWNAGGGMQHTRIINNLSNKTIDDRHRDGVDGFEYTSNESRIDPDEHFMDWQNGDFRLRSGSSAIDAGTGIAGVTTGAVGAPDIGASEHRSADAQWWTTVGCDTEVQPVASPSGLVLHLRPGYAVLEWQDNAGNETGYLIERSWHVHATGDKGIKGTDFTVIAQVGPDVTRFVDRNLPVHEENKLYYRVRAVGSGYTNYIGRPAGFMGPRTVGFEASEGYQTGGLDGQSSWRGHYPAWATPFEPQQPTGMVVADSPAGRRAEFRSGNGLPLNYYGDLAVHDRSFDPTSSSTVISLRLGLKRIRSGDGATALGIGLGGPDYPSHWEGPQGRLLDLDLTRGGNLKLGGSTLGAIAADGSTLRILLDWSSATYAIEVDGTTAISGRSFDRARDLSKILLTFTSTPHDDSHAAWVDNIAIGPQTPQAPALAAQFLAGRALEGTTTGLLVASDVPPTDDLDIEVRISGSADADDIVLRQSGGGVITATAGIYTLRLPAGQQQMQLDVESIADGTEEGQEDLVLTVVDGVAHVADTALASSRLLIQDGLQMGTRRLRVDVTPGAGVAAGVDGATPQALPLEIAGMSITADHRIRFAISGGDG
ncbi:MAG: hypothetical protein ACOCXA_02805, partial [Planctomycetota bacterium]